MKKLFNAIELILGLILALVTIMKVISSGAISYYDLLFFILAILVIVSSFLSLRKKISEY